MKSIRQSISNHRRSIVIYSAVLGAGLVIGHAHGQASRQAPADHEGVSVVQLGLLQESSLKLQIGLEGYEMKLREITVEAGGAIKQHSHASRPGLVQTISGSWTEVRNGQEFEFPASKKVALVEDESTDHWLYNDGPAPAVAVVCGPSKVAR